MDEDRDALGRTGDRTATVSDVAPVAAPKAKRRISWRTALGGGLGIAVIVGTFVFVLPRVADYRDVWAVVKTLSWAQVGLLVGATAALVLLVDVVRDAAMRMPFGWAHLLFFYAALIVELLNIFIHERDGWTAVVPIGMTLSIIGTVLILVAAWLRPRLVEAVR